MLVDGCTDGAVGGVDERSFSGDRDLLDGGSHLQRGVHNQLLGHFQGQPSLRLGLEARRFDSDGIITRPEGRNAVSAVLTRGGRADLAGVCNRYRDFGVGDSAAGSILNHAENRAIALLR